MRRACSCRDYMGRTHGPHGALAELNRLIESITEPERRPRHPGALWICARRSATFFSATLRRIAPAAFRRDQTVHPCDRQRNDIPSSNLFGASRRPERTNERRSNTVRHHHQRRSRRTDDRNFRQPSPNRTRLRPRDRWLSFAKKPRRTVESLSEGHRLHLVFVERQTDRRRGLRGFGRQGHSLLDRAA